MILIKEISCGEFIDMKKLSLNDSYFVTLDSGLYLYNSDFSDCSLIYYFDKQLDLSVIEVKENDAVKILELDQDIYKEESEIYFIINISIIYIY